MAKDDFMPHDEPSKAILFCLFCDQIGQFLPTLGIAPNDPDILQQAADAARYRGLVDFGVSLQASAQTWTVMKNWELLGTGTTPTDFVMPTLPANFPPAVVPGIEKRFRRLVRRIKLLPGYKEPMGKQLGVVGVERGRQDLTKVQPEIELELKVDHVAVVWGWGGDRGVLEMLELEVDRGDGKGFVMLYIDATPGFKDVHPLPVVPTKWKYRAIYWAGDKRVGEWSAEKSVTVGG